MSYWLLINRLANREEQSPPSKKTKTKVVTFL